MCITIQENSLARFWLDKAASQGHEQAQTILQLLEAGMLQHFTIQGNDEAKTILRRQLKAEK